MKDSRGGQLPSDSEKQGYKFLLDSLREQLLRRRTIEETAPRETQTCASPYPMAAGIELPEGKKYFRIGEVAALLGVEAYVLRYWENEFGSIRPKKSRSGQRIYDRRDVQQLATVHYLLHVEKYSLQGAKRKLIEIRKAAKTPVAPPTPRVDPKTLQDLAAQVRDLIRILESAPH